MVNFVNKFRYLGLDWVKKIAVFYYYTQFLMRKSTEISKHMTTEELIELRNDRDYHRGCVFLITFYHEVMATRD